MILRMSVQFFITIMVTHYAYLTLQLLQKKLKSAGNTQQANIFVIKTNLC